MATSPTAANVTCKKQGQPSFGGCLPAFHDVFIYMCIYIYIYIYVHVHVHIHIHISVRDERSPKVYISGGLAALRLKDLFKVV